MMTTAQPRSLVSQPRSLATPGLWEASAEGTSLDKGPKHTGFDAPFLGAGRRGVERALRQDRKR